MKLDFEVTFDPKVWAMGHGLIFSPERHELLRDGEWIRWVRKQLDMPYLFVYHHRLEGKFVLAAWLIDPSEPSGLGGVAKELATMSAPPDRLPLDLPDIEYLRIATSHYREQAAESVRKIREEMRDRNRRRLDQAREKQSVASFMKRTGRELEGHMVASGQTPYSVDNKLTGEVAEELNRLSKVASRS